MTSSPYSHHPSRFQPFSLSVMVGQAQSWRRCHPYTEQSLCPKHRSESLSPSRPLHSGSLLPVLPPADLCPSPTSTQALPPPGMQLTFQMSQWPSLAHIAPDPFLQWRHHLGSLGSHGFTATS